MNLQPFAYPPVAPERKHGPSGYGNYPEYKDWLRDEFVFRCAYCQERELWYPNRKASFAVEHLLPQSARPDLICDYDNLTYACLRCNSFKQDRTTLDPTNVGLGRHIRIDADGGAVARTREGAEFIKLFHLADPPALTVRQHYLRVLRLKATHPDDVQVDVLFRAAFSYPDDLPDLRPPAKKPSANSRPKGVHDCHFVRRLEHRLPDVY